MSWYQQVVGIYGPEQAVLYVNPVEGPLWMADEMSVPNKLTANRDDLAKTLQSQSDAQNEQQLGALQNAKSRTTTPENCGRMIHILTIFTVFHVEQYQNKKTQSK